MKTLEDIINLCKDEAGKVFIMDTTGDVELVLMGVGEYEKLKNHELRIMNQEAKSPMQVNQPAQLLDAEAANREILIAQLREQAANFVPSQPAPRVQVNPLARQDLREEVIDPSFNFDGPDNSF